MDRFEDSVLRAVRRYGLLRDGQTVLVAVSGGPDSVALLLALLELRPRLGISVQAAHVNHMLRGAESDRDEQFVRGLCEAAAVRLHVGRLETREAALAVRQNLEDYARKLRYQFLFEVAAGEQAVVATGHNQNDLSETFLLKLFRGAGLSGLSGVYPLRRNQLENGVTIDVVRPLLDSTRSEILEYLIHRGRSFQQDSSNQDLTFDRNLLRHQLIPMLEERLNPEITRVLGRTAFLLREMEDYLSPLLDQAYQSCRAGERPSLRIPQLLAQHPFVQKEIVRRAIKDLRGSLKDVSARHVEEVLNLAQGESGSECHLGSGVRVRKEFDVLELGGEKSTPPFVYELPIPGDVYISEVGKRIVARRVPGNLVDVRASLVRRGRVLLDFSGSCLGVRNRRAGDRYRTGTQTKKLKEILIERRIPRSRRDELIVLDDGGQIVWVEGLMPDPDFRAEPGLEQVLEIAVEHETFPR